MGVVCPLGGDTVEFEDLIGVLICLINDVGPIRGNLKLVDLPPFDESGIEFDRGVVCAHSGGHYRGRWSHRYLDRLDRSRGHYQE